MSELPNPTFQGENEENTRDHPLFGIAERNLTAMTQAAMLGRFSLDEEHARFDEQLEDLFPNIFKAPGSGKNRLPQRELPLILAICQKESEGIAVDDYFIAIPLNFEKNEDIRRILRPDHIMVSTMFGDLIEVVKKDVIYTRFLSDKDRHTLPRFFNPK